MKITGSNGKKRRVEGSVETLVFFDWVVFSSVNGVKNVEDRMKKIGTSLSKISKTIQIAAVGRKTAALLSDMDAKISFVPPSFVAEPEVTATVPVLV